MNLRTSAIIVVASLLATGCRQDPWLNAYLESLNTERRMLEDEYYALEYDYNDQLAELELLRNEKNQLLKELGREPAATPATTPSRPRRPTPMSDTPELMTPEIDLGTPTDPQSETPRIEIPMRPREPQSEFLPVPSIQQPVTASSYNSDIDNSDIEYVPPDDLRVTHVVLNPFLTSGLDFDGQPGDDGLWVVIEPRNAQDEYVPQAGQVSVVVLDPAEHGERARVARWDLDAAQASQFLQYTYEDGGLHLELPWTNKPPAHAKLHLFVQYTTDDGRKLETDREIEIVAPGQFSQRWTPRLSDRSGAPNVAAPVSSAGTSRISSATTQRSSTAEVDQQHAASTTAGQTPLPTNSQSTPSEAAASTARPVWKPYR